MQILVINAGSTSLKYKIIRFPEEKVVSSGRIEGIGQYCGTFTHSAGQATSTGSASFPTMDEAIVLLLKTLTQNSSDNVFSSLGAIAFKTVLARNINYCVRLDDNVLQAMEEMNFLAPTHNPPYIAAIRAFGAIAPAVPLIGLFEPAFHHTIPEYAWRYPLPYDWAEKYGIRRYGFHGASHRYAAERAATLLGDSNLRLISCHLGGSSSINATRGTSSCENSFGLSPQSGLMQSARPGDIDPFIPLWMMEHLHLSVGEVRDILFKQSGLAGMSGISGEMRDILTAADGGNPRATLTAQSYAYQVRKHIGASSAVLGGVDCLLFTGGIGERSSQLRELICNDLGFLNIIIDSDKNRSLFPDADIAAPGSVPILIIEANEELVVARAAVELLGTEG